MEAKRQIRKKHLAERNAMTKEDAERLSEQISDALIAFFSERPGLLMRGIYGYYPHKTEVSLQKLYAWLLRRQIPLAFPVVSEDTMAFYPATSMDAFVPGAFGILEPAIRHGKAAFHGAVCLVPGSVFDRAGNRYGYGKGYYDRYFSGCRQLFRIGIAYESQVEESIPAEEGDVCMHALATERGIMILQEDSTMEVKELCKRAKEVRGQIAGLSADQKNAALSAVADRLLMQQERLLSANAMDMERGQKGGMSEGLLDRLKLNEARILQMAQGLRQIADLDDPIGEVISMKKRPNGLLIGQKRVPLGVVGIIYESRPNVTADAFGLCFKTGNVVILRGGKDALHSNQAIVDCIQEALREQNVPVEAVSLIADASRESALEFMRMNGLVDVLIPRGGAGLIRAVVEHATVPVIETGTGNCHIYVDAGADLSMALAIIKNAKTQRIGVCNACESLLLHKSIIEEFVPPLVEQLAEKNVEIRADERILNAARAQGNVVLASEEDWGAEYLDYIISAKSVASVEEAITHINRYNTGHSEAIVTNDYANAQKFLDEVDAAAVYVNASTRFTDGFEFGFGAEIGISTQKLHARGPMGLLALTSAKYIIYGNGQIRK